MFDIGFSELVVIGLVALVVLGPKRLPEAARAAGKWMGKLRRFMSEVRHDFDREMRNAEIMELSQLKQELDATRQAMFDIPGQLTSQIGLLSGNDGSGKGANTTLVSASPVSTPKRKTKRRKLPAKRHGRTTSTKRSR